MEKEVTNSELLESINRSFSKVEEKMATKEDILALQLDINGLRSDLKSFKNETNESVENIKKDVLELEDTDKLYDKRLENLENKVFA